MRFARCVCDEELLVRIPRSFWMRLLFPSRGLYYCWSCNGKMLIRPLQRAGDAGTQPQKSALA